MTVATRTTALLQVTLDIFISDQKQNKQHGIAVQTTECRMQHGIDLHWCADNPVFLETERLIARCIHRQAAEVDLELGGELELELGGEEEEEQQVVQVTSAPDPDLSRLLRPAPVSTCPSPASSEGGVYTSVSLSKSLSEIILATCVYKAID